MLGIVHGSPGGAKSPENSSQGLDEVADQRSFRECCAGYQRECHSGGSAVARAGRRRVAADDLGLMMSLRNSRYFSWSCFHPGHRL